MESWRKVWRVTAKRLSTPSLQALKTALEEDDHRLIQGSTTSPPPLMCVGNWPCEGGCLIGFCGIIDNGGFIGNPLAATVEDVEEMFARTCYEVDNDLGEPGGIRWLLNWFDETDRKEVFQQLLPEVSLALEERGS